jgi:predicted acylesterase/phospholipase RssA
MAQLVNLMSALERESLKLREHWADVMVKPDVGHLKLTDYGATDELLEAGRAAAKALLPKIRQLAARTIIPG